MGQYAENNSRSQEGSRGLLRSNTVKRDEKKCAEQKEENQKRQKMLARAKSLCDLNRKFHGYSPTGISYDSDSNLSASSIDSLSDIDFTHAMKMISKPRNSPLHRSQSQAVIYPTKSIIRKENKKQKHTVSFRN